MSRSGPDRKSPLAGGVAVGRAGIDPATSIGAVELTVSSLGRARAFYERVLGLRPQPPQADDGSEHAAADGLSLCDAAGGPPLVVLHEDPAAPAFDPNGTGLFHLALLVPSRLDLAHSLQRIARARWPLTGASDHLVSEALYLRDPDGNGVELYADRPRPGWALDERGAPRMATLPLDLHDILSELAHVDAADAPEAGIAAGTTIGHVHLQVSQIAAAEHFYGDVLGFDIAAGSYPGALFVSAGGYHHHIGLNTWQSLGAEPLRPGRVGLRHFELVLPDDAALQTVLGRVDAAVVIEPDGATGSTPGTFVRDPSGIAILLRSA